MLTLYDEFAGAGGSTHGAAAVPGVEPILAANHNPLALDTHATNFPQVEHYLGDVQAVDIARFRRADLFWASPACPPWTDAAGRRRDFDRSTQGVLFGPAGADEQALRARALMEEIPRYLRHWAGRGRPVLAGVVENVVQCRAWDQWRRWLAEIHALGYRTRVIAFNSMHARPRRIARAPQSRDRLYVAYWHVSLGRCPDWDKWLRPRAHCPGCDQVVEAIQVFKRPGADMGRYRAQYLYRCPRATCRNRPVEPAVLPAAAVIDWNLPGTRIGDRDTPLADKTIARIRAGLARYAHATPSAADRPAVPPFLVPLRSGRPRTVCADADPLATVVAGGSNHALVVPVEGRDGKRAASAAEPMRTQTARHETGIAVPPLLVPAGGTWNQDARPVGEPFRTRTSRDTEAVVVPPFIAELRGGGSDTRPVTDPLATVCAAGTHHDLTVPPGLVMRNNTPHGDPAGMCTPAGEPLRTLTTTGHQSPVPGHALYAYDTGELRTLADPLPTQTTVPGDALLEATPAAAVAVEDCYFRMLEPHEIGAAMAFAPGYIVLGSKRDQVRQYGNAVTPPVAEILISALVEAITGEEVTGP